MVRKHHLLSGHEFEQILGWELQTTLPASWEICMQIKKQHLELDMEQETGSTSGKEYLRLYIVTLFI